MPSAIMHPQTLVLSETGKAMVEKHVVECEHKVAKARLRLEEAQESLRRALIALNCNHELKKVGGVTGASETVCTKCGFSWYD